MTKIRSSTKIKISLALIVAMLMTVFMPILQISAASLGRWEPNVVVQLKGYETFQMPFLTVDGEDAFCLDMQTYAQPGEGYIGEEVIQDNTELISKIAYYGFQTRANEKWNRVFTQLIIWEVMHGAEATHCYDARLVGDPSTWPDMISDFEKFKGGVDAQIKADSSTPSFNTNSYTIKVGESLVITDTNNIVNNMRVLPNDTQTTIVINGNQVTITANTDSKSGEVRFTRYPAEKIGTPIVYTKPGSQTVIKTRISDPERGKITLNILQHGSLEFTKVNEDGQPMDGAQFRLTTEAGTAVPLTANGNVFTVAETGDNLFTVGAAGKATIEELPEGNYIVTEITAPVGTLISVPMTVAIKAGEATQATMNNRTQPLKIRILKQGADGKVLAGAVFQVSGNGITPFNLTTGADGTAVSDSLKAGTYTVTEITPPLGYMLSNPVSQQVTLVPDRSNGELVFTATYVNALQPLRIQAIKLGQDNRLLQGAVFTISGNGITPFDFTTDANGQATSHDLPAGTYTVTEKTAPTGYVLDTTPGTVTLVADQSNQAKTFTYRKTDRPQLFDLKLYKQDLETGTTPQGEATFVGAEFEVKLITPFLTPAAGEPAAGDVVGTITTDANGYGELLNLPLGRYEVKETKAPEGYVENPNVITVDAVYDTAAGEKSTNVTATSNEAALVIENDAAIARLEIVLNGLLPDAEIGNLLLDRTVVGLEAVPQGSVVYADTAIQGRFEIVKHKDTEDLTGSGPREPEANITFNVLDAGGNVVDTLITNAAGKAASRFLPFGTYTLRQMNTDPDVNPVPDQTIVINNHREVKYYTLENAPNFMRLRITKIDAETKKPILKEGAVFEIYDANGKIVSMVKPYPVTEVVTQFALTADGYSDTFSRLRQGNYTLKEVKAPEGYVLTKEEIPFEVPAITPEDGELIVKIEIEGHDETLVHQPVENTPQKGRLTIDKRVQLFTGWTQNQVVQNVHVDGYRWMTSSSRADAGRAVILERLTVKETAPTETTPTEAAPTEAKAAETVATEAKATEAAKETEAATETAPTEAKATQAAVTEAAAKEEIPVVEEVPVVEAVVEPVVEEATPAPAEEAAPVVVEEAPVVEATPIEDGGIVAGGGGQPVWDLVSDDTGKVTKDGLVPGLYVLKNPDGSEIARSDVGEDGIFTYQFAQIVSADKGIKEANNSHQETFTTNTPTWAEGNLSGVTFELRAAKDILSMDNQTMLHRAGDVVKTGTTAGEPLVFDDIPLGDYVLVETKTANGYILDSTERPISFTPAASDVEIITKDARLVNERQELSAQMTKTMLATPYFNHEVGALSNVLFGVYTGESILGLGANSLVALVRPDANGKVVVRDIPAGSYYFKELFTDQNYHLDNRNFTFTVSYDGQTKDSMTETGHEAVNAPETTDLELIKVDVDTGKALAGARFSLTAIKNDGSRIPVLNKDGLNEYVTDSNGRIYWTGLENGNYIILEIAAPDGYYTDKAPIKVTLDADLDRKVTVTASNKPTELVISKIDYTSKGFLPGATLELVDKNGKVIDTWVSTDKPHVIKYLTVGETYSLRETKAPEGYATADKEDVTISEDPSGTGVGFINKPTTVEISKKDATTGEELPGASMKVTDDKGNVVDEWISGTTPHIITKLEVGKTYTLHEDLAPIGYAVASSVNFTIKDTGEVQKVEMYDELTKVTIEKDDVTDGRPVPGAEITVYDENGKEVFKGFTDKDGKTHITGLEAGKTYTFKETIHPYGYTLCKDTFTFKINLDGTVEGQTKFSDEPTRFEIKKTDEKGNAMKDVGFQLFTDAGVKIFWTLKDGIWIADANGAHDTVMTSQHGDIFMQYLPVGKYILKETFTPAGYKAMKDMTINLTDDHGISNPLKVTVKNEKVTVPGLPRTGESDTLGFVFGGLGIALASVLVLLKKRKRS